MPENQAAVRRLDGRCEVRCIVSVRVWSTRCNSAADRRYEAGTGEHHVVRHAEHRQRR